MISLCLRSIRKHSAKYDLDVLVIDNGSRDASLDYLRSLSWIRLIERPEESMDNWPTNVFTAWDLGLRQSQSELFVTMHTDVFVKRDDWLDPFLEGMNSSPRVAASGAWKLNLENPWYALQKRVVGSALAQVKRLFGKRSRSSWKEHHYPRDYCAMYRRQMLLDHHLTFCPQEGELTGGYAIARQLWEHGYETRVAPLHEVSPRIVHVAHGTAAVAAEKPLHHRSAQSKVEKRVAQLFAEPWISALRNETRLDAA